MYTECSQFQFIIINVESVRSPHMFLLSTLYPTFYCGSGRTKVRPFLFFVRIGAQAGIEGFVSVGREPLRPALGIYGRAMRTPMEYGCSVWRAESWPRPASSCRCAAIHLLAPYEIAHQFTFSRPAGKCCASPRSSGVAAVPLALIRQPGGGRKASLTLTRAARPKGGEG